MLTFKRGHELRNALEGLVCRLAEKKRPESQLAFATSEVLKRDREMIFAELSEYGAARVDDEAREIVARVVARCKSPEGRAVCGPIGIAFLCDRIS